MTENKTQVDENQSDMEMANDANVESENVVQEEKTKSKTDKKTKKLEEEIASLKKQLDEKNSEIDGHNDRYMRMMAEYDNFRKRSAKEKDNIYSDAYADALTDILPIIDNLERAVGFTDAEQVLKGVEMILKSSDEVLVKMGIEKFGEEGDQFDPNVHNAVMTVDDENHKEGEIVSVFQKGYKRGDRIIRYAMVTVAN